MPFEAAGDWILGFLDGRADALASVLLAVSESAGVSVGVDVPEMDEAVVEGVSDLIRFEALMTYRRRSALGNRAVMLVKLI